MAMVLVGLLLLAMKVFEFGFASEWPWWGVLLPFGLALVWWYWADASGLSRRRAMEKDEARKAERRKRNVVISGAGVRSGRKDRSR